LALELDIYSLANRFACNVNILWTKKGNIRKYTTFCEGINEDAEIFVYYNQYYAHDWSV
jgi:hypothetical protein